MDYGRTNPPTDTPDFFTSGAGTNDENVNNFEANNNIELNNPESSWNQPMTPERDQQSIGNKTIISSELPMPTAEMPAAPRYGEIIDLNPESAPAPTPFPDQPEQEPLERREDTGEVQYSLVRNEKLSRNPEKLTDIEVKELNEVEREFLNDENAEKLFKERQSRVKEYINRFDNPYWNGEEKAA